MKTDRRFDEVMIVNPYDPAQAAGEGANVMQFHYAPGYGYYAASPYGYYGAAPGYGAWGSEWPNVSGYAQDSMSGYAEPVDYYAEEYPVGYYAEEQPIGYYGDEPPMGYYAEEQPVGYYGEEPPMGYYADEQSVGYCSDGYYADGPEMVGWGDQETSMGYYGADDPFAGYVRAGRPQFNPGCPMPTNVAGYEDSPLEGYARPRTVNAMCESFKPQPDTTGELPETFKPIW